MFPLLLHQPPTDVTFSDILAWVSLNTHCHPETAFHLATQNIMKALLPSFHSDHLFSLFGSLDFFSSLKWTLDGAVGSNL